MKLPIKLPKIRLPSLKITSNTLQDLALVLGFGMLLHGLWLIYPPIMWIIGGLWLLVPGRQANK